MRTHEETVQTPRQIKELIERLVWARTGGGVRELVVVVDEDCIRLDGVTDTYYNKQLASHAVMDRFANRALANNIDVC